MKFNVKVMKRMYALGDVEAEAASEDEAILLVKNKIEMGAIQTTDVVWDESQYEDMSFETLGEAEAI